MFSPVFFLALIVPAVDGPPPAPPALLHPPGSIIPACVKDAEAFQVPNLVAVRKSYLRYVSLTNEPTAKDVAETTLIVKSVLNRLSQKPVFYAPVPVAGGRALRVDLYELGIDPKAFDRLISVGSGRVPQPEPFHYLNIEQTFEEEVDAVWGGGVYHVDGKYYPAGMHYKKKIQHTKKTLALAPWLSERKADGTFDVTRVKRLVELTQTPYPLVRGDWLCFYSLLEPRYHELLGLPDTLDELFEHLGVDKKKTDAVGAESRGVVQRSEVAVHNRALNRYPTLNKRGKGVVWVSDDFNTSIKFDNLLSDARNLLNARPAAHEVLWTLPNGLMGAQVYDGQGKRLDRADTNIALDRRNHFSTVDVEIRNCFCCHAAGYIEIRDRVRSTARGSIRLQVEQIKKQDERLAQQIVDRFFITNIKDETEEDSALHDLWNKPLTGRAAAADGLALYKLLLRYEKDRTLKDMAFETGYPEVVIKGVLERARQANLGNAAIGLLDDGGEPGKARIDQLEEKGFADLMQQLHAVKVVKPDRAK